MTKELFNKQASTYAEARPSYPMALFKFLASLCKEKDLAWDCACGNGQASHSLAELFNQVIATDVSEPQIKKAKPNPKIQFYTQAAEDTALEPNSLDLICVAQAVHWLNRPIFFEKARSMLKTNGIMAIWGYKWSSISNEIDTLITNFNINFLTNYWAKNVDLINDKYVSLEFPFTLIDSPTFYIELDWTANEYLNYLNPDYALDYCNEG